MGVKGTILLMKSFKITLTAEDATFLLEKVQDSDLNPHVIDQLESVANGTVLYRRIEEFLISHELPPFWIPTIDEMGKYKGGHALVKFISEVGGLKKVRQEYAEHMNRRYDFKKLSTLLSNAKKSKSSEEIVTIEETPEPQEELSQPPEIVTLNKQSHPLFNDD